MKAALRVRVVADSDPARIKSWLRRLIEDARLWKAAREKRAA